MREAADKILQRSRAHDRRRAAAQRPRRESRQALRQRQQGHRADRHLGRKDPEVAGRRFRASISTKKPRPPRSSRRRCASCRRANDAMTLPGSAQARPAFLDALAVYLKPRVLIVMLLGFSSGLPLALSGTTLLVWMREAGVDLGTIGLFALVGTPYTAEIPVGAADRRARRAAAVALLGRRRGWLVFDAIAADRGDRLARRLRSGARARAGRASPRCWSPPPRRRRTSWSTPSGSRACRRTSRPPAWRPTSPPTASACWSRPPARCSW